MKIRITAGAGIGQVIDAVPAYARARIAGGTAVAVDPSDDLKRNVGPGPPETAAPETAALDPATDRAVAPAQHPPKRKPAKR